WLQRALLTESGYERFADGNNTVHSLEKGSLKPSLWRDVDLEQEHDPPSHELPQGEERKGKEVVLEVKNVAVDLEVAPSREQLPSRVDGVGSQPPHGVDALGAGLPHAVRQDCHLERRADPVDVEDVSRPRR